MERLKIACGAEAVLYKDNDVLVKERVKKGYRIKEIDERLRSRRTRNEASLLRKAKAAGVLTPQVIDEEKFVLRMQYIDGKKVKDVLNAKTCKDVCKNIGKSIGILHSFDIIHGDLTTSNMIVKGSEIYFIDFGLGFISKRPEDKATDLYLLHEALESTHYDVLKNAWKLILKAYVENYGESNSIINALKKVEMRRRYTNKE
jgi:Kae1-associated kinase Bud32